MERDDRFQKNQNKNLFSAKLTDGNLRLSFCGGGLKLNFS